MKVEEVRGEVLSLKKLLQNRVGAASAQTPNMGVGRGAMYGGYTAGSTATELDKSSGPITPSAGGLSASDAAESQDHVTDAVAPAPGVTVPKRESSSSRFGRGGGAAIPAWQMAAKKGSDGGTSEAGPGV